MGFLETFIVKRIDNINFNNNSNNVNESKKKIYITESQFNTLKKYFEIKKHIKNLYTLIFLYKFAPHIFF